ncbi:STE/STE11 protein kinase [Schizosaccharomyces cryophilus OY26]|uniref:mitogen-activated protein kinase kinase kinase n=1 Tax=Schizosaccharomyces cryophilus (strain OY26 / ATCC MYA-4695 / CBS 11777 / NBRC 106824 / NRRL Y48691) TaxID=653667 RepID=S9VVN6_SCHCR|nr:STE/STE11 protein kinase [Schizosaccharomyces cryophilus OY26]EPY50249.1 STE/STE11 protein kinase [Schizosaccharomyces cryophilus OY26]
MQNARQLQANTLSSRRSSFAHPVPKATDHSDGSFEKSHRRSLTYLSEFSASVFGAQARRKPGSRRSSTQAATDAQSEDAFKAPRRPRTSRRSSQLPDTCNGLPITPNESRFDHANSYFSNSYLGEYQQHPETHNSLQKTTSADHVNIDDIDRTSAYAISPGDTTTAEPPQLNTPIHLSRPPLQSRYSSNKAFFQARGLCTDETLVTPPGSASSTTAENADLNPFDNLKVNGYSSHPLVKEPSLLSPQPKDSSLGPFTPDIDTQIAQHHEPRRREDSFRSHRDSISFYFSNSEDPFDGEDSDLESETLTHNWGQSVLSFPSFIDNDLMTNPKNKERFEWQYMLNSVLTSDIVKIEKLRLRKIASSRKDDDSNYSEQLWLEIWCWLTHRSIDHQKENLKYMRGGMIDLLLAILNFRWEEDHQDTPIEAVDRLLNKLEKYERLYPSRRAILADHSLYASESFQRKLDVLTAYSNSIHALLLQTNILRNWVGNDDLDITRKKTHLSNNSAQISDGPFVERLCRECGLIRSFEIKIMVNLNNNLTKVCNTLITYREELNQCNLPRYVDEYLRLVSFPSKLIKEILCLRMSYAESILNVSPFTIDSLLYDLRSAMSLAVDIMQQHAVLVDQICNDQLTSDKSQALNDVLVSSLKVYFDLLKRKVNRGCALHCFKETEVLEDEWDFLSSICPFIQNGYQLMTKNLTSFVSDILVNINQYLNDQLEETSLTDPGMITSFYIRTLDSVRIRFRKLMNYARTLKSCMENSSEYVIRDDALPILIQRLCESNHVLTYTASIEHEGAYVIVPGQLENTPNVLRDVLSMTFNQNRFQYEGMIPYVIVLSPNTSIYWTGRVMDLDVPEVSISMAPNRVRLVTAVTGEQLVVAQELFSELVGDTISLENPSKANSSLVNKEMTRTKKHALKLALSLLDAIQLIRTRYHGRNCQNLIHYSFSYAIEFAQRLMRLSILDPSSMGPIRRRMIMLAISWVGFIYDDCSPTDRNTFRWTVTALEFAMIMTYGSNILMIDRKAFEELRDKVGKCMALLLLHFDVMGSINNVENPGVEIPFRLIRHNPRQIRFKDEEGSSFMKEEVMQHIAELEARRRELLTRSQLIGRVLDDTSEENRLLKELASAKSNITIRWQQGDVIGTGSFGTVYRAVNLDTGDLMAVKTVALHKPRISRSLIKRIKGEMIVLELLDHPNIVCYYGIEVHREKINIFMELYQGSTLAEFLRYGRIEDELVIQVYALQLLEGLTYIHSCGVSHRDVKPENILFDHNGVMKFTDFGSAKISVPTASRIYEQLTLQEKEEYEKEFPENPVASNFHRDNAITGSPMYMAPELLLGTDTDKVGAMDIWSLGCVIVEMATGSPPWPKVDNRFSLMFHIATLNPPIIPQDDQLSPMGQNFLKRCFVTDPEQRATATDLLMDPWVYALRVGTEFDLVNNTTKSNQETYSNSATPIEL